MKTLTGAVLALTLCGSFVASQAQAAALGQFKSFIAATHAARGEFTQRQVKTVNGQVKVSNQASGRFMFARPGKFIWLYQKPYDQLLQSDGDKLFIYDKDLNQVTTKKLGSALSSSPAAILFGSNDLEKNFTLKEAGKKDGLEWLQAIPKDQDSTFAEINIGLQDGVPHAMELRDNFGQTTMINLLNIEKNPVFKADQFIFMLPAGADVFNQ